MRSCASRCPSPGTLVASSLPHHPARTASANIALGWYAHAIPKNDHEAAELLGALLSGTKPQDNAAEEEEKSPEMSP